MRCRERQRGVDRDQRQRGERWRDGLRDDLRHRLTVEEIDGLAVEEGFQGGGDGRSLGEVGGGEGEDSVGELIEVDDFDTAGGSAAVVEGGLAAAGGDV